MARRPLPLRQDQQQWLADDVAHRGADDQLRRARRLALALFELEEGRESAERQLHQTRFHPAVARDVVNWAWDHRRIAATAARGPAGGLPIRLQVPSASGEPPTMPPRRRPRCQLQSHPPV